jgi:serine/threonine protein kinase/formylglycine-generating enzyme required for sulfatase activity
MSPPERSPIEGLSLEQANLVDELCDAFEGSWRHGERLPVERFLARVADGPVRAVLFRELLSLELELRGEAGESPVEGDYLGRFPDRAQQVRALLRGGDARGDSAGLDSTEVIDAHGGDRDRGDPEPTRVSLTPSPFPAQLDTIDAGTWVGPYQLLERLGAGAMGVVYRAWRKDAGRYVALKLLRPRWGRAGGDPDGGRAETIFFREARAAAGLSHEAIATIHDVGQADDLLYYAMNLIEGPSLADRLRSGPMAPRQAAELLRPLSRAIAHAHANGVVHRGLKPGNVLLDRSDRPYLVDFGLARLREALPGRSEADVGPASLCYMPPEQVRGGEDVGPSADIYSLGAMLYETITGSPPFRAPSSAATLDQVLHAEPVAPRRLNPSVPRDLETICLACLQKGPRDRYASAGELADDLDRFLEYRPPTRRPLRAWDRLFRWAQRRPVVASMIVLTTLAASSLGVLLIGSWWREHEEDVRLARQVLAAPVASMPILVRAIEPRGAQGRAAVAGLLARARPRSSDVSLKTALILVRDDPRWARDLARRMLDDSAIDHRVIREALGARTDLAASGAEVLGAVLADRKEPDGRRVRAACGLIGLSPHLEASVPAPAWSLLAHGTDDTLRSLLIDWLERVATPADTLLGRLTSEPNVSIRRALVQALCRPDEPARRVLLEDRHLSRLWERYRRDPDPGTHGGLAAVFRSRGLSDEVERVDRSLQPPAEASWFINRLGQTCVRLPGRQAEKAKKAIGPFAVALTKTTLGQYLAIQPGPDGRGEFRAASGCPRPSKMDAEVPVSCVSYVDAMRFCRRLSELDGMSEDRMCYPPLDQITLDFAPPRDAPGRTGWRLPTIDEWEYLARAGTRTDVFFGTDDSIVARYAWCGQPLGAGLKPVGWHRPNEFGLNEPFGNVYEWCSLPDDREGSTCHLRPHPPSKPCDCGPLVAFRGGSWKTPPVYFSASPPLGRMNGMRPDLSHEDIGFRIVRTLTPEEARLGPLAAAPLSDPAPL